jgi:hypothetical protein
MVTGLPCRGPEPSSTWFTPMNSGCSGPLIQDLNTKRQVQKEERKRELSHSQLSSWISLKRIKTLFGPIAQRQNRRWKYLFVSKALTIPGWKAHLGVTYCRLSCSKAGPPLRLPPTCSGLTAPLGRNVGSLSQQKPNLWNENYSLLASESHK